MCVFAAAAGAVIIMQCLLVMETLLAARPLGARVCFGRALSGRTKDKRANKLTQTRACNLHSLLLLLLLAN